VCVAHALAPASENRSGTPTFVSVTLLWGVTMASGRRLTCGRLLPRRRGPRHDHLSRRPSGRRIQFVDDIAGSSAVGILPLLVGR
jgi:hypothetical protein